MSTNDIAIGSWFSIDALQLQLLIDTLRGTGYRTVGPRIADGSIIYGDLE
jgi:hypothetical protein